MKHGLLARIEAKPEHAEEVAELLAGATRLADEAGRTAHLRGQIAAALGDAAQTKLVGPADIRPVDLPGVKGQGSPS